MDADCESKLVRFASEMQPVAKLQRSISLLIFELEQATQESKNSWIVWKVKHLKHFLNMLPGVFSLCFERWLALPKYTSGFFQTEDIVKAILLEPQVNNLLENIPLKHFHQKQKSFWKTFCWKISIKTPNTFWTRFLWKISTKNPKIPVTELSQIVKLLWPELSQIFKISL